MDKDLKVALGSALVVAAIEYPVSQYYETVPPTHTAKRMAIAGAMAFAGAFVAAKVLARVED